MTKSIGTVSSRLKRRDLFLWIACGVFTLLAIAISQINQYVSGSLFGLALGALVIGMLERRVDNRGGQLSGTKGTEYVLFTVGGITIIGGAIGLVRGVVRPLDVIEAIAVTVVGLGLLALLSRVS